MPERLVATTTSTSEINLSWSASNDAVGVSGYNIYRSGAFLSNSSTTYSSDTGLSASTQYCYQVSAYDAAGNDSAKSTQSCATTQTPPDTTAPTVPSGLAATAASTSQIHLSWSMSSDAIGVAGYKIYRAGTYLKTSVSASATDTGLLATTQYCYQVTAIDSAGNESPKSTQACATTQTPPDTTAPTVPSGLAATAASTSQIHLSWTASTDAAGVAGYKIYRGGAYLKTSISTYSSDTGLSASTQYCYQVSAYDAAGNDSAKSTQSCATTQAATDTTAPSVPSGLTATAVSTAQINLSWSASTDAVGVAGYKIYRAGVYLTNSVATSAADTTLSADTQYCYQVSAYDAAGNESAKGTQQCATTHAVVIPDSTAPSVPSGLTATAAPTSRIGLNWTASTDAVGVAGYKIYRDGAYLANSVGTSASDISLSTSTQYCYQVKAYDAAGNESAKSTQSCATTQTPPDTTAPSVPTGLTATAASTAQINLSWSASTDAVGVTGYKIYRAGVYLANSVATSASDTSLFASTQYCYQVSAYDAAGNESAKSTQSCATTQTAPDTTAPSVPTGLTATAVSTSQIDLSWTASTDAVSVTGYKIYRSEAYLANSVATSASDTSLSASTQYCYQVSAYDAAGNESFKSTQACATTQTPPDTTAPSVPTGLTATAASTGQVNLSWTAATDAVGVVGYKIYRGWTYLTSSVGTSTSDTLLFASTEYCYQVSAYDAAGNESAKSTQSCATTQTAPDTTAPSVPTGLTATAASTSQVNLSWTAATDAVGLVGYKIYREGTYLSSSAATSTSDVSLSASTQYCYQVSAYDAAGNQSAKSTQSCVTTQSFCCSDYSNYVYCNDFTSSPLGIYTTETLRSEWRDASVSVDGIPSRVNIEEGGDGNRYMKVFYPIGSCGPTDCSCGTDLYGVCIKGGGAQWLMKLPQSYEELYVQYWVKFENGFEFVKGGKLPGFVSAPIGNIVTGCNLSLSDECIGWSAIMMWTASKSVTQYFHVIPQYISPEWGTGDLFFCGTRENCAFKCGVNNSFCGINEYWTLNATVNGTTLTFKPNQWYKIKIYMKMNDIQNGLATPNGIIKGWLDNELAFEMNDMLFRNSRETCMSRYSISQLLGIDGFYFTTFFGGRTTADAALQDEYSYFDNFIISTTDIQ